MTFPGEGDHMDTIEVDAFLADAASTVQGKIYALGVGWNVIAASQFPARHSDLTVAMIVHIPYLATNMPHRIELRLEDSDGHVMPLGDAPPGVPTDDGKVYRLGGDINVGRPASLPPGDEQIVPLTMTIKGLELPRPDAFRFVISVDGIDRKLLRIRVQAADTRRL
jgi:hypothetical protein